MIQESGEKSFDFEHTIRKKIFSEYREHFIFQNITFFEKTPFFE